MNAEYLTAYNQSGDLLGVLENAGDIAYSLPHNDLWTASFTLPSSDAKNELCQAYNLIHLPDGTRETGLYRIIAMPSAEETAAAGTKTYSLEHVMATLLDDVLFGYHEIGGVGVPTAQVISYILARQSVQRWVLGVCEYTDQFSYKFENTSLLSALLSLGNVITDEYTWEFDTSQTPWRVNLRHADTTPGCGIHYMRNMVGIESSWDATSEVTRLYLLGYGEGVNQLTIRDVNGGLPYVDADNIDPQHPKCSVFVDTKIEDAATLKARGMALVNRLSTPYYSYTASAIDLNRITGQSWDTYMPGKLVRVLDGEHGIDINARIVNISKSDVGGRPGEIEITIANAERDTAESINTLADRLAISELYSQGATNLYSQQYADNADANHPAVMRVYVPKGCVRINQMLLSWKIEAFRAYETGASAGGATTTTTSGGGGSTATSSSGGGSEKTSSSGGATTLTEEQHVVSTTGSTGGSIAGRAGDTSGNTGYALGNSGESMTSTGGASASSTGNSSLLTTDASSTALVTGEAGSHNHAMGHYHDGLNHTHTIASHTHSVPSHVHTVPSHSHSIASHSHTGPSHRHSYKDTKLLGHTHSIPNPGTSASTGGYATSLSLTEDKYTGYAGTGDTGGTSLTTDDKAAFSTYGQGTETSGGTALTTDSGGPSATSGAKLGGAYRTNTGDAGTHSHSMATHTHGMEHTHTMAHTHSMAHYHNFSHMHNVVVSITIPAISMTIPGHTHTVNIDAHTHTVEIPSHTHDLTLPDHTHEILFGIYEGTTANSVGVIVDGTAVPASALTSSEMDIVDYLEKDDNGKIRRGTWHEIKIVPNALTRIEANLFVQAFIQSVGGGDF